MWQTMYFSGRRWPLGVGVLALVLVLSGCGLVSGPSGRTSREAGAKLELAQPTPPPTIDVVFVVDQSQSMGGGPGEQPTDPQGLRFPAVRYAIASIGLKGTADHPHRVGLVQFGTDAPNPLSHALVPTTDITGLRQLDSLLTPRNMIWTNFMAALRRAEEILSSGGAFQPNHRPAIIIFTDGTPEDSRHLSRASYFQEISGFVHGELTPRGCSVYLVAVDSTGKYWLEDRHFWERITGGRAYSISSVQGLKEEFNEIVSDILQLPRLPKDKLTAGDTAFSVGPYLEQIEFHIFGRPRTGLQLVDPSGNVVTPKEWRSPDYSILSVSKPIAGEWRYRVAEGVERLTVYRNEVPVRPRLVIPRPTHPIGKPMRVLAEVRYADGTPLREFADYPVRVTARIVTEGEKARNLTLSHLGGGMFDSESATPTGGAKGLASVDIVLHAGTSREYVSSNPIQLIPEPYFVVSLQTGGYLRHYADYISVTARLYERGSPIAGDTVFQSPTAAIRAQLTDSPSGELSPSIWLDPKPKQPEVYVGSVPTAVRRPGRYTVTYAIGATDVRSGRRVAYSEPVSTVVMPTWLDRAIVGGEFLAIVVLMVGAVLALAVLCGAIWAVRLPRMRGGTLTISYEVSSPAQKGRKPERGRVAPKAGGLEEFMKSAAPPSPETPAQPATSAKTVSRQYRLSTKFLLCRPGRFFFVHRAGRTRLPRVAGVGRAIQVDMSRQSYVIRYLGFPVLRKQTCKTGNAVTIGKHTLSVR